MPTWFWILLVVVIDATMFTLFIRRERADARFVEYQSNRLLFRALIVLDSVEMDEEVVEVILDIKQHLNAVYGTKDLS